MDDVLVVAGGQAWPFYRLTSAYVCQAGRSFRDVPRMAFYTKRAIQGAAARIEHVLDHIELSHAEAARRTLSTVAHERRIGRVLAAALAGAWSEGPVKVVLLSPIDDPRTIRFDPVAHHSGTAWTMGQRYTKLARLRSARSTMDLAAS